MFWNPATIPGLGHSQLEASGEIIFPDTEVASTLPAGFGPGVPPIALGGETSSDRGPVPCLRSAPRISRECSPLSFGLGIFAVAGFGLDYATSATESRPDAAASGWPGLWAGVVRLSGACRSPRPAAYEVERAVVGRRRPNPEHGHCCDSIPACSPRRTMPTATALPPCPSATHGQTSWGGGFILGEYDAADIWTFGASVKSPQWFETFEFNSANELGQPASCSSVWTCR